MNGLEITKELKNDIEVNQIQLQNAIRNHQNLMSKAKEFPVDKEQLLKDIKEAEEKIIHIGFEQKNLLDRLREEYKAYQKTLKNNVVKTALEERRFNLSTALNRARKQNLLPRTRTSPCNSHSDDSENRNSPPLSPDTHPISPHDVSQSKFLGYFRLATHEVYGEMQKKRAERKRRSTANPHFLYGHKGWDFLGPPVKRKRSHFLAHPPSPPNTRGRKKQEMARAGSKSPPAATNGSHNSDNNNKQGVSNGNPTAGHRTDFKPIVPPFPSIPNLPSGLVIERISSGGSSSPDSKQCIVCKQPGALSICEQCSNGFHMSCHNRPFARTPKECPRCLLKEGRRSTSTGSHSATSAMTISYVSPTEFSEKLQIKQELEEKHEDLVAELTQLQNRHSELTISLKNQEIEKEQLETSHQTTEAKVNQLIKFIENVQNFTLPERCNS